MTDELVDIGEICPVCLLDDVVLVKTHCNHKVCLPCMERLLTIPVTPANERNRAHGQVPNDDDDLDVPTRGRCPMCREPVCLFELENVDISCESPLAISKDHKISSTGLAGRVYVSNRSAIGDHSIHFPSTDDGSDALPYIDFSLDKRIQLSTHRGEAVKMHFQPDCHFHEATRTFHGRIRWSDDCAKRYFGSMFWEYSIAFSADFQYATRGVLVKRRDTCQNPDCMESMCKFRLDGRWRVSWPENASRSDRTYIVHDNVAYDGNAVAAHVDGVNLLLAKSHDDNSGNREVHAISLKSKPWFEGEEAIKIGETIEIGAPPAHPKQRMLWTREAFGSRHLDVVSIGCGSSRMQYHAVATVETLSSKPIYVPGSVWGNTFCQALTVGLASYHFMESIQKGAYISYENELTSRWPPLDNGSPIPTKIWFTEASFDASKRIFRGKIDWYSTHGTTWQGCRWWR